MASGTTPQSPYLFSFIPAESDCRSRFELGDCRLWHYCIHGHCKDCLQAVSDRVPINETQDGVEGQERRSATHDSLVCQTRAKTLLWTKHKPSN